MTFMEQDPQTSQSEQSSQNPQPEQTPQSPISEFAISFKFDASKNEIISAEAFDPSIKVAAIEPKPAENNIAAKALEILGGKKLCLPQFVDVVKKGVYEDVETLLKFGIDPNSIDSCTALIIAVLHDREDLVELLIKYGADVNLHTEPYDIPLLIAIKKGNFKIVKLLVENGAKYNGDPKWRTQPLHVAAHEGHIEIAEFLLEKGADINLSESERDKTKPIYKAVYGNKIDMVKFLIDKKADLNFNNLCSVTPLTRAIRNSYLEIAKLLLERGADVNFPEEDGIFPINVAIEVRDIEMVKLLIEHKANINKIDKKGNSPLYYAADIKHKNIVEVLLMNGAVLTGPENRFAQKKREYISKIKEKMIKKGFFPAIEKQTEVTQVGNIAVCSDPLRPRTGQFEWDVNYVEVEITAKGKGHIYKGHRENLPTFIKMLESSNL